MQQRFAEMMPWIRRFTVYTDWTAIALLLFTAVPLAVVVATATSSCSATSRKHP